MWHFFEKGHITNWWSTLICSIACWCHQNEQDPICLVWHTTLSRYSCHWKKIHIFHIYILVTNVHYVLHKRVWLGKYIVFTFCESVHIHLWSIQFLRCAFWIWVLCRNSCFFLIKLNWWKIYCLVWSRILAMNIYDTMGNYQSFFTHVKCLLWTRKKFKLVQSFFRNLENISIGIGKTIVEFFSVEMVERVCRYLKKSQESHGPHPIKPNEDANVPIVVI